MKRFLYNIGYFFRETWKIIHRSFTSNILSLLGTGLILFLLGLVFTGWGIGNKLIEKLSEEAEISIYYDNTSNDDSSGILLNANQLMEQIKVMEGVREVVLITEEDAYLRMEEILGEEAKILNLFEENPFESYIEVRIDVGVMSIVLEQVNNLEGVNYVRDNRSVVERIQSIINGIEIMGVLIFIAVGITTLVIISHMIRQGIYHNREQIYTLQLLGAPSGFIGLPFLMSGFIISIGGSLMASLLLMVLINHGYRGLSEILPFVPLPNKENMIHNSVFIMLSIGFSLGLIGSFFGLISSKER